MRPTEQGPNLYMLVGLPGSGKSTYATQVLDASPSRSSTISTDKFIERRAKLLGLTYRQVFECDIENAVREMKEERARLFEERRSPLAWDQTNLSRKVRQKKLALVPRDYCITCIYFELPLAVIKERNLGRVGRGVPESILFDMASQYQRPTLDEGFSLIVNATAGRHL